MTFNQDTEESDGFQAFIQNKGFNREKETPQFQLIGTVDSDKRMLYNNADDTFAAGLVLKTISSSNLVSMYI